MQNNHNPNLSKAGMRTYYWDFFGPRAESTAEGHIVEINEFFESKKIEYTSGVRVLELHHHVTWVRVPPEGHEAVDKTLRPKRWADE